MRRGQFFLIDTHYTLCDIVYMSDRHNNERGSWFCGTTKCPADMENIKNNIREFFYWAFITHKPDDDDDRLHIHWIVQANGTRTIKSIADTLDIDPQYMQVTKRPRSYNRYLIHLDNPEKEQYNVSDVTTNNLQFFQSFLTDNQDIKICDMFDDLERVKNGLISPRDFVNKYEFHLNKLPFYQKIKSMEAIMKIGR